MNSSVRITIETFFVTANFNNMRTPKLKAQPTNAFFRYHQSNVRRLLPASDYCRALFRCLNRAQRFDYHALGSSRKLRAAAEHFIDGSENAFVGRALNFIVRMLLKGAVRLSTEINFASLTRPSWEFLWLGKI